MSGFGRCQNFERYVPKTGMDVLSETAMKGRGDAPFSKTSLPCGAIAPWYVEKRLGPNL